jgi:protocatechuate 3,4-dioxygenase beta subunit
MYFDDEPLNDIDRLLNEVPSELRSTLIASRQSDSGSFEFNVVLAKV